MRWQYYHLRYVQRTNIQGSFAYLWTKNCLTFVANLLRYSSSRTSRWMRWELVQLNLQMCKMKCRWKKIFFEFLEVQWLHFAFCEPFFLQIVKWTNFLLLWKLHRIPGIKKHYHWLYATITFANFWKYSNYILLVRCINSSSPHVIFFPDSKNYSSHFIFDWVI